MYIYIYILLSSVIYIYIYIYHIPRLAPPVTGSQEVGVRSGHDGWHHAGRRQEHEQRLHHPERRSFLRHSRAPRRVVELGFGLERARGGRMRGDTNFRLIFKGVNGSDGDGEGGPGGRGSALGPGRRGPGPGVGRGPAARSQGAGGRERGSGSRPGSRWAGWAARRGPIIYILGCSILAVRV